MHQEKMIMSLGRGNLCVHIWEPKGEPIGVLQIVHGISEHAVRYDGFANYMTQAGYLVVAEDHMGHGKSLSAEDERGYFRGGWFTAVGDTYQLLQETKKAYPGIPYVLFGHSMGSFIARTILAKYPDIGIAGCVICGTGWQPEPVLKAGIGLCKTVCKIRGEKTPSKFLHKVIFGAYNKRVERPRTPYDWLTRVDAVVDAYMKDPLCGFVPASGLIKDMLTGIAYIQNKENMKRMKASTPVFFIAGGDDPVGDFGNGVQKCAERFSEAGMENVAIRIYPLCRHELLNELNKTDVMDDIREWMEKNIQ